MSKNKSIPTQQALCAASQQATQFCINKSCIYTPVFVCQSPSCQCRFLHGNCTKSDLKSGVQTLKSNTKSKVVQLKDKLSKKFDEMIFELIEAKNKMLEKIKNFEELDQMKQDDQELERLFMEAVKNHQNAELLNGDISYQVWKLITKKHKLQKAFIYDFISGQYQFELIQQQLSKTLNRKIEYAFDAFQKLAQQVQTKKVAKKTKKIIKDTRQNKVERIQEGWKKWLQYQKQKKRKSQNKRKSKFVDTMLTSPMREPPS